LTGDTERPGDRGRRNGPTVRPGAGTAVVRATVPVETGLRCAR